MKAIIEMPKGDDRRRHFSYDKTGFIDLGPIKNIIPVNDGIMPVHYGFIPETLNETEGDEIDVLILSQNGFKVGQEVEAEPIALIRREDKDDKIVAVDKSMANCHQWGDVIESDRKLIEEFFSYHHKIQAIEDAESARRYVQDGQKQFLQKVI